MKKFFVIVIFAIAILSIKCEAVYTSETTPCPGVYPGKVFHNFPDTGYTSVVRYVFGNGKSATADVVGNGLEEAAIIKFSCDQFPEQ